MAAIIAKREALKKKQAAELVQRKSSKKIVSPAPRSPKTDATSGSGEGIASPDNSAIYDRLSGYKTKGVAAREAQEEEDRLRREGQERRRKALAKEPSVTLSPTAASAASPPPAAAAAASPKASVDGSDAGAGAGAAAGEGTPPRPSSAPPRRGASASGATFENLFNKKTQSMIIKEKQEEEERAKKEKKLQRQSSSGRVGNGAASESESEPAVFDKLYTKKLKGQEIAEKVEVEEKQRMEKLEAHISGKAGAAAPVRDPSPLLRKTKSALVREHELAEERARLEEEERIEREKQPAPLPSQLKDSPSRPPRRGRSRERMSFSSDRDSLAGTETSRSVESSPRTVLRRKQSATLDDIQATRVDDDGDTDEDEAGLAVMNGMSAVKRGIAATESHDSLSTGPSSAVSPGGGGAVAMELRGSVPAQPIGGLMSLRSESLSTLTSPRVDVSVSAIPGLVPRTPMNMKVTETAGLRWEGKVCARGRDVANMLPVKGSYASRAQCLAIVSAHAPPVYVVQGKNCLCVICEEPFNKYLKADNCRNCGQLVCPDCSNETWPQNMLPESFNETKSPFLRVCKACNTAMERFAAALKSGDLDTVISLYKAGNVNLHHPFSTLPEAPYPVSYKCCTRGALFFLEFTVDVVSLSSCSRCTAPPPQAMCRSSSGSRRNTSAASPTW
jgi:hypothetical protein